MHKTYKIEVSLPSLKCLNTSFEFLTRLVTVIIFNHSMNMECADLNNLYVGVLKSLGLKPHLLIFFSNSS